MSRTKLASALTLSLIVAAGSEVRSAETAPRLQVAELSGALELGEREHEDATFNRRQPQLMAGTVVRVTSGTARFESDNHVDVSAVKGDSFLYKASAAPTEGEPGVLSLSAVGGEPSAVAVGVGGLKLGLGSEGAVDIASARGNSDVQVTAGRVDILEGSVLKEGESLVVDSSVGVGTGLRRGDRVSVMVPLDEGFTLAAMEPSRYNVARKTVTVWESKGEPVLAAAVANERDAAVERIIADWPEASKAAARVTIEAYGTPGQVTPTALAWSGNGPWLKTVVFKNGPRATFPAEHRNILRQAIRYGVPQEKAGELAKMGIGVKFDPASQELSSVSEAEETNFLALNLARDVAEGRLTAREARAEYARTIQMASAGSTVPAMQGLLF
ncbi:MAG: hypothetical protein HYZ75_12725 [Elusimicrobia bacterium]|nr:hypothetical protein [Elusimicrobiota bacterium]